MKEERNIITMNEFGNVVMPKDIQVEKARVIDPFGHAGFDPSGKTRLTP